MFLYSDAAHYHGQPNVFIDDTGRALFEIDDSKSKFKLTEAELRGKQWVYTLGDLLDHPELYDNYPRLRTRPVFLYSGAPSEVFADGSKKTTFGAYRFPDPDGRSSPTGLPHHGYTRLYGREQQSHNQLRSSLLHEVQHDIQRQALAIDLRMSTMPDWMWGSSAMEDFASYQERDRKRHPPMRAAAEAIIEEIADLKTVNDSLFSNGTYAGQALPGIHHPDLPVGYIKSLHEHMDLQTARRLSNEGRPTQHLLQSILYYYSSHEVMAREVEARQNLSMSERLTIRPQLAATWPTEGPAFGSQRKPIFIFGNQSAFEQTLHNEDYKVASQQRELETRQREVKARQPATLPSTEWAQLAAARAKPQAAPHFEAPPAARVAANEPSIHASAAAPEQSFNKAGRLRGKMGVIIGTLQAIGALVLGTAAASDIISEKPKTEAKATSAAKGPTP